MSSLKKQLLSKGKPPFIKPINTSRRTKDYTIIPWQEYFTKCVSVKVENGDGFCVYEKGNSDCSPLVVFIHGGGFSALSWALCVKQLDELIDCTCISIDLRGHGSTTTSNCSQMDINTLSQDVSDVIERWTGNNGCNIVLVGHSLGGSVAVHTSNKLRNTNYNVVGLVVMDVVEGSAIDSLRSMKMILNNRPKTFPSSEKAIEWSVRTGYIKNIDSARVSMIGQLKENESSINEHSKSKKDENDQNLSESQSNSINEKSEASQKLNKNFEWRINLMETEQYWKGWFEGLSSLFLSIPSPKLLLLAGIDRLDKELMVGQMQGKFQMTVLMGSGHAVHEDKPSEVADQLCNFMVRHRIATRKEV